jgi:hypothetical protein
MTTGGAVKMVRGIPLAVQPGVLYSHSAVLVDMELAQDGRLDRAREMYAHMMRRDIRGLRILSLDGIDPIIDHPASISKAWSSKFRETMAQMIERILRDTYESFFQAFDKLRKSQEDSHRCKQRPTPRPGHR